MGVHSEYSNELGFHSSDIIRYRKWFLGNVLKGVKEVERYLIIIGAGLLQVPAIQIARQLGLKTIVVDRNGQAMGMPMADIRLVLDTKDAEAISEQAKLLAGDHAIAGVFTVGTDMSITVATVAAVLGLPGIPVEAARRATNKVAMRQAFAAAGVPSPRYQPVYNAQEFMLAVEKIGFPAVLKPSNNMGARGVRLLESPLSREELASIYVESAAFSAGELLVEEYMEGPELSVDALIYKERITFAGIADRILAFKPYFVETGHNMPSAHPESLLEQVREVMTAGIKALGISHGAAKGDIKVTPSGVRIGELAARLSGGFMSAYTYPYSSGVSSIEAGIKIAIGEDPGPLPLQRKMVCIERSILAEPGFIEEIHGPEYALNVAGVRHIFLTRQKGDLSVEPRSNVDKLGHIIAEGKTLEEAEQRAAEARARLQYTIRPFSKIDDPFLRKRARLRFSKSCHVCPVCDGRKCASGVPGMGGDGDMITFAENTADLDHYRIVPSYIHDHQMPDLSFSWLGKKILWPVMIAPVTGVATNMGGQISEEEFVTEMVYGSHEAGTVLFLGEGTHPQRYQLGWPLIQKLGVLAVPVFKPHGDESMLAERIHYAQEFGALAWGIDIDSVSLATMKKPGVYLSSQSVARLRRLRRESDLPMIVKGVMSKKDFERALESGADSIYISNHGGRIMDGLPSTIRILSSLPPDLLKEVPVLIDGGFRFSRHIYTALALGATAVLLGRPAAIYTMGGNRYGLRYYLQNLREELLKLFTILGLEKTASLDPTSLLPIGDLFRDGGFHRENKIRSGI